MNRRCFLSSLLGAACASAVRWLPMPAMPQWKHRSLGFSSLVADHNGWLRPPGAGTRVFDFSALDAAIDNSTPSTWQMSEKTYQWYCKVTGTRA